MDAFYSRVSTDRQTKVLVEFLATNDQAYDASDAR